MAVAGAPGVGKSPSQRTGLSDHRASRRLLTVLEDPLHVEAIGGAGFVVGAAFEVVGQFSGSAVVDDSRIR